MTRKPVPPSIPYRDGLLKRLKNKKYAADYLDAVIEDSRGEKDAPKRLLMALRDVAEAQDKTDCLGKSQLTARQKKTSK